MLNSYRMAVALMSRRALWDIRPVAWRHRRKVRSWKNRYSGGKALILCNGPTLNHVDFELVSRNNIFTFGLNKIHLLFKRTTFRPSVVVAVNPYVVDQCSDIFRESSMPIFLDKDAYGKIDDGDNVHFLYSDNLCGRFAHDCSGAVNQGYTVTFVAMQLAFYMGFFEVGIVGCDHRFATKGTANVEVASGGIDRDHFDSEYFSGGEKWQLPDLPGSEFHYEIARREYERFGRKLVNCTESGNLEVLPRSSLSDFLI